MSQNKVLFKLSGSIACFKAAALISQLVQSGCEVQTVVTASALKFIGEATLEGLTVRKVLKETFESGDLMGHINWAKWADLVIVYPATANTINKLANGIGDDLLGALFLAHNFKKPYLVAPAMNTRMLEHPATRQSLERLKSFGVEILSAGSGNLACGDFGAGRVVEPAEALQEIKKQMTVSALDYNFSIESQALKSKKVLITLGGTREAIDSVRAITNTSTGSTGAVIADWISEVGHDVSVVCGVGSQRPRLAVELFEFRSFADLNSILEQQLSEKYYDSIIHLAAVSDYSVEAIENNGVLRTPSPELKIDGGRDLKIHLKKNFKILDRLRGYSKNKNIQIIAFKLTTNADEQSILQKIEALLKNGDADFVVHNDLSLITAASHPATIFNRNGEKLFNPENKQQLAEKLESLIREVSL